MSKKGIDWFRTDVEPSLEGHYEINYRQFDEGDFGSLNQVEFNSKKIGGNIDFWEQGWLGIFVWDYESEEQLVNILIAPSQEDEKEKSLANLVFILQNH